MGCICSKGGGGGVDKTKKKKKVKGSKREEDNASSLCPATGDGVGLVSVVVDKEDNYISVKVGKQKSFRQQKQGTVDMSSSAELPRLSRLVSLNRGGGGGSTVVAGWPPWLASVAAEAIQGWVPRSADTFERICQIGQGTYSSVYKARDLETGKIVAMKKVRFANMDPESVRFMAREIHILRKLDHPNVMKLVCLVTARASGSLYLVFDYMEHDLAGLLANPAIKFSEPQIKCYMQQLLQGLEYCHSRGVLHRDIKGSNLLIDDNGVLKIGDFGLATFFRPDQQQPLTSRVVTLWYRAPELLLGATEYGVGVDLWSAGCILGELFVGKPALPGRTEVEQMHKILKICGSPSEDYWKNPRLPHACSFRPKHTYRRHVADYFKSLPPSAVALIDVLLAMEPKDRGTASSALSSEFLVTDPLPCSPSSLPKYPPSKEFDAKLRERESRRRKVDSVKEGEADSARMCPREVKASVQIETGFSLQQEALRGGASNSYLHPNSSIHPNSDLQRSRQAMLSSSSLRKDNAESLKPSTTGYAPKKSRMHCSGPLMSHGGNMDEMLKEHERQIQEAVRKARVGKSKSNKTDQERGHRGGR
uniref:Protein kinase domain-containing protein n=1 Tax=Kalanchoe fedtschenkoi TaxID=63787 RepID=A0A7N0U9Q8_KALFE